MMLPPFGTLCRAILLTLVCSTLGSCASMEFQRETESSGTFVSTGVAFTFLSMDFPGTALSIARGNASDARRPNTLVEKERIFPYLGWFDWLFEIIGVRHATVSGTWGFPPETTDAGATPESNR